MAKESVLSLADKEAIKIEKLIFHVILTDTANPIFLEELEITDEQQKFFRDRLADASQGRQYIFTEDNPPIKILAKQIIDASDEDFLKISKDIASRFKSTHTQNMNNGVFIISIASIRTRKLLFLIKLDHKKVYEYKLKGNKALLEEVKNTFSEDKTAIQKVALIDINPKVLWDVLVFDRSQTTGITKFFGNFLSVIPRETETDLTKKAQSLARRWATENKDKDIEEPSVYKNRARNYLLSTDSFDSENYIEAVIQDTDEEKQNQLRNSFREFLAEGGLYGQSFPPRKDVLTKKEARNIRQTAEGVKIEWEGTLEENNISISNERNKRGLYEIRIETFDIKDVQ